MRPRGSYGDVTRAILAAAGAGPGPVRALAERAQVGYQAAYVACSRLRARGELVPVCTASRPAVLALPGGTGTAGHDGLRAALDGLQQGWWGGGARASTGR